LESKNKTDTELISMMKDSSQREHGYRLLLTKYQERLYMVIRRIVLNHGDADDVFQNTMIKIFNNVHRFEQKASLFTWMYKIASNEALSFLRANKRLNSIDGSMPMQVAEQSLAADQYFEGDMLQLELMKAVAALPEKQREVFQLKYFDNMKYSEMSEMLDLTEGALKASYFHAVKKIETHIKNINI
jgi:RNA polymerase sigma factor (sigma-70 family)